MREKDRSITYAVILLEKAERAAEDDPAAALPKLREALEVCREVGVPYLETRILADLGWALALLGQLDESESVFEEAKQSACSCSQPILDRRLSRLRDLQDRMDEAVALATRAVEASEGTARGRALDTLGIVRYHAGAVSGALEAFTEALAIIPLTSRQHPRTRKNLAVALTDSDKLEDVQQAERIFRGLPEDFKGTKYLTVERAKVAWALAETLALIAHLDSDLRPWEKRQLLREARHHLEPAARWLARKCLPLHAAASRSDLAAIKAQLDPLTVLDTLEEIPAKGKQDGKAYDVSRALEAAKAAADVVYAER